MNKKNRKKWYHKFCYFAPEDCDHCSPFCDCKPEWIEEDEKQYKKDLKFKHSSKENKFHPSRKR